MVEKIPVRPESVRGLGNIISPAKTLEDFSVFNSSLSYVDGFYTMEYSTTSVRIELTASASSIRVGESLTLTATVTDGGTAVEGASVSFTSGNLAIGTAVTGSDGVATLTVSTLEAGSYSITATYDEVVSSAVTVTVSYGFTSVTVTSDKSILSYTDSEAATLTAQLKNGDASASVSGETVEFYKYVDGTNDVLLGSGVTDSNGEALYTYASTGVGDVGLYAKVRSLVSKIFSLEDCIKAGFNGWNGTFSTGTDTYDYLCPTGTNVSPNITLPSSFKMSYKFKNMNTDSTATGTGLWNIGTNTNNGVLIGHEGSDRRIRIYSRSNGSNTARDTQNYVYSYQTWTDAEITYENGTITMTVGGKSVSYNLSSAVIMQFFNSYPQLRIAEWKIKPL